MNLGDAITARALDTSGLTDLVDDRVFWRVRPQGSPLPALVLNFAGGPPEDLDLEDEGDTAETRIQFSGLGATHEDAHKVIDAATAAFIGSFEVEDFLFWDGERERPIDLGSDTQTDGFIHEAAQDVSVRHTRIA